MLAGHDEAVTRDQALVVRQAQVALATQGHDEVFLEFGAVKADRARRKGLLALLVLL